VRLARLHRRLVSAMALAALVAYAAGNGVTAPVLVVAAALALSLAWLPPAGTGAWIERVTRAGVLLLCAWLIYAAVVLGQDFMPGVMAMLLFLLGGEALRPLEARNDMRLYSLSFALLIAATAYYPGPAFAVGFVTYVGVAVLAMMVGYLRRESERFAAHEARIGRRFLATTAALSLVTLGTSGFVFVLFPRLPRAWNVQGRRGGGGEVAGFSDRVSIGEFGGRIGANPQVMFRAEFPGGPPPDVEEIHWRGRGFEAFDGESWSRSIFTGDLPPEDYLRRWGGPVRTIRIFGGPPGTDVIFGPAPVFRVQPRSAIRVFRGRSGDLFFAGSDNPVYLLWSIEGRPSDARLREGYDAGPAPSRAAVALPALDPRIFRLADSLTAGKTARIDQVRAVEGWLKREFTYTLDLPSSSADASLESFLFRRRRGHCEYFSTAMAVLLRAKGIPTRNVNGFLGGEWNAGAGYLAVTGDRAHSWVEVWFPEWGWVPFDPTPPGTAALLDRAARGSWLWSARLWMDGLEYRWNRWVLDYDLDRQLGVFRGVGAFFTQGGERAGAGPRRREPVRFATPWLLAVLGAGAALVLARGLGRRRRLPVASRAYLSLRRAYARAGWAAEGDGPLAFAETLTRGRAPGAEDAARAVDLYLRARFGAGADEEALSRHAASAKAAVRKTAASRREAEARRGEPARI
jgi:transglutaminase-like putative cysteine protease